MSAMFHIQRECAANLIRHISLEDFNVPWWSQCSSTLTESYCHEKFSIFIILCIGAIYQHLQSTLVYSSQPLSAWCACPVSHRSEIDHSSSATRWSTAEALPPPHTQKHASPSVFLTGGPVFFWGHGRSMLTPWCNHLRNKISIS